MKTPVSAMTTLALFLVCAGAGAGASGGPVNHRDTVLGNHTDSFSIVFDKGKSARVLVNGDGSTDLDCAVYDNGGHYIDSDNDPGDTCLLQFTPAWTGKFTVKVINRGSSANEYTLRTN